MSPQMIPMSSVQCAWREDKLINYSPEIRDRLELRLMSIGQLAAARQQRQSAAAADWEIRTTMNERARK